MKKILLNLVFLLTFGASAQIWCDEGANWKYSFMNVFGTEGYTEIRYVGDSIINGRTSQKLVKRIYAYDFQLSQPRDVELGVEFTYEEDGVVYL